MPRAAARTDRARLAREGDEPLERAVVASDAREAVDEQPAAEEAPELPFDEGGEAHTVAACGDRGEERLEMVAHHAVEDRAVGDTRGVRAHGVASSAFRAAGPRPTRAQRRWSPTARRLPAATATATGRCAWTVRIDHNCVGMGERFAPLTSLTLACPELGDDATD